MCGEIYRQEFIWIFSHWYKWYVGRKRTRPELWDLKQITLGQSLFVCQLKALTGLSLRYLPVTIIYECELEKPKQFKDTLQKYKSRKSRIFKMKNSSEENRHHPGLTSSMVSSSMNPEFTVIFQEHSLSKSCLDIVIWKQKAWNLCWT